MTTGKAQMLDSFNQTNSTELIPAIQVSAGETSTSPSMRSPVTSPIDNEERPWTQRVVREAQIFWHTTKRDLTASIVPALLFMIAAWSVNSGSFGDLFIYMGRGVLFFAFYIYTFCLSNQLRGLEEDRINKPDRPLASGAISYEGAQIRYSICLVLYSLIGWWFGALEWALLWQVGTILHNECKWDKNLYGKNFIMGLGTLAQLAGAWQMVTPITQDAWRWIIVIAIAIMPLMPLQDLRDMEGDRLMNRKTFPLVYGETATRVLICVGFALFLPLTVHFTMMVPIGLSWATTQWEIAMGVVCWIIAARVVFYRSPKADNLTYALFPLWYCIALISPAFVF
ncbi:UbiA family prenyltransferase [Nostoc sp. WHI]|uniref:UbiA family prenyltransferase n=1 Tax=Nostoc sp. WHI TaxID=2650611 RepID=UPI0018C70A51|nr:UbiA family prenyltransferase [Nostoc sp. WHI]MBG1270192.1 ubiquinone biosynthesis protein UbiA [Nostoc sp. WHI]